MVAARWILALPAALLSAFLVGSLWAALVNQLHGTGSYVDILVSAVLFGASFTLAAAAVAPRKGRPVRLALAGCLAVVIVLGLLLGPGGDVVDWARTLTSMALTIAASFAVALALPDSPRSEDLPQE
jgi:phosphoglycerol transferase MdoB-like AlkP superfamily enzyme